MSEASARMHLRDYVTDDDVNMGIRMMLESFVETQKYSVMKTMRATFQKFLSFHKDNSELLYYILRQLCMDQLTYMRGLRGSGYDFTSVEISEKELLEKAKSINITDVRPFYESRVFKVNNFSYDPKRKIITQTLHGMLR